HPWIQNEKKASNVPLGDIVRTRLKQFSVMNTFKKKVLRVIAEHLSIEEVEVIKDMFTLMDSDGDGKVTFDELKAGLKKVDSQLAELEYGEFVAVTIHLQKMENDEQLRRAFMFFDRDGSGYIELDELEQVLYEPGQVDIQVLNEIMKEVDTDKVRSWILASKIGGPNRLGTGSKRLLQGVVHAKESGKDSQDKKNNIKGLLVAATDCEPHYLIRILQDAKIVKQAYSVIPVYDKIVPPLYSRGLWDLPKTCCFSPAVPVGPMLAKPTKGVSEIWISFKTWSSLVNTSMMGHGPRLHGQHPAIVGLILSTVGGLPSP
ncbi:hypothetical protein M8C21_008466, partial [Ambrosia artemisiifolia]